MSQNNRNSNNRNKNRYKKNNRNKNNEQNQQQGENRPRNNQNNKNSNKRYQNQRKNYRNNRESILKKLNQQIDLNYEYVKLIHKLNKSLQRIVSFVDPCSEEQLLWKQSYENWDIKEILGHIIQCNKLYKERLEHILSEDQSEFKLFDQDAELKKEEYDNRSLEVLLKQLVLSRKDLELVCLNTKDEDWLKSRNHPEKGELSFKDIVTFVPEHDEQHLQQIFMNMQRFKPWYQEESPEALESNADQTTEDPSENSEQNVKSETEDVAEPNENA